MRIILLVLLSITAILAQKPVPCNSPPQWESRLFEYDEERRFFGRAFFSYDSIYQRERIIDEFILQDDREAFDTLRLHSVNTEYVYNFRAKNCTRRPITRPWRNFGIPQNATSYGESYIGSSAVPNANLLTTLWGFNFTDGQGNQGHYMGAWTLEACIPVSITIGFKDHAYHAQFFDVTPGISDPSRFIPRSECLQ